MVKRTLKKVPTKKVSGITSNGAFIGTIENVFWENINITSALPKAWGKDNVSKKVKKRLSSLGSKNLRFLLQYRKIHCSENAKTVDTLSNEILNRSDVETLFLLNEFAKGRDRQIEQRFQSLPKRLAFEEMFENLPGRKTSETIKPFTKLLLLYFESKQNLLERVR